MLLLYPAAQAHLAAPGSSCRWSVCCAESSIGCEKIHTAGSAWVLSKAGAHTLRDRQQKNHPVLQLPTVPPSRWFSFALSPSPTSLPSAPAGFSMPVSPSGPGSEFPDALPALPRCHSAQLLPGEGFTLQHLQGEELRNTTKTFSPKPQTTCEQGANNNELSTRPDITHRDEISDRRWGCSSRTEAAWESKDQ